jgi:hypothetical protein
VYHQSIIEANLLKHQALRKPDGTPSLDFEIIYHSVAEVDRAVSYFRSLIDLNTLELKRKLRRDERQWARNERLLCRIDFNYWATRYAKIRSREGTLIHYTPNVAQRIIQELDAENEFQRIAIAFIQLKARQLGVSTDTELRVLHRAQFYSHVNAVVSSSDPDKSTKMAGMMELAFDEQPFYLRPRVRQVIGELLEFPGQDSAVSIQHGSQFTGIARGTTPTVAHLSELSDYKNAEDLVDASLMRAMHDSPWMFLVLESTAMGRRNWWHRSWQHAKENWDSGRSRLRPIFLPWFVGTDLYPSEAWLRARPVPTDWIPTPLVVAHAERARAYVRVNPLLRRFLGDNWEMPREQLWFYEVEYNEHKAKQELNKFFQEMPADDLEAFQSTNISVFDAETISAYHTSTCAKNPVGVYTVLGLDIPDRLRVPEPRWDRNQPPIQVRCAWGTSFPLDYTFQPVMWEGYSADDGLGKLYIWEKPEDTAIYGYGCDTSDGLGQDRSVLEFMRKGDTYRNDCQVAEYAYDYTNAFDLWPFAMAIGTYYSVYRDGMRRQIRAAIECKGNGEVVQNELRKRGWTNFHPWVRYDNVKIRKDKVHKLGIVTVYWFRSMLVDWVTKALRDGWIDLNSPWFVEEMEDWERDWDSQDMKAAYGGHDDRIMSLGFILLSLYDTEIHQGMRGISDVRERIGQKLEHPLYTPGFQGSDIPNDSTMQSYIYKPDESSPISHAFKYRLKPEPEERFDYRGEYDL